MANLRADNLTGTGGRNAIDGSVFFDGSSKLSVPNSADVRLGSNDFTIEAWIKVGNAAGDWEAILGMWDSSNTRRTYTLQRKNSDGELYLYVSTDGGSTNWAFANGGNVTVGDWHHVAGVRDGNTLRVYLNGVEVDNSSYSGTIYNNTTDALFIGDVETTDTSNFNGYISNARLVNGTCLYPSGTTFTPPTQKLTTVANTQVLACQDSDDPTQEATGKTITGYGNLQTFDDTNLVTNGGFIADISGWTNAQGTWAWNSGKAHMTGTSGNSLEQNVTTVVGKIYRLTATVDNTANVDYNVGIDIGGVLSYVKSSSIQSASRTFHADFTATATTTKIDLWGGTSVTGYWSNASVKLLDPPKAPKVLPPVGIDEGVVLDGYTKINSPGVMYFPTGDTSQRGRGRGVIGGGFTPTLVKTVQYIEIQSSGTSVDFGDKTDTRYAATAVSSTTRGVMAAGHSSSSSPYPVVNTMDYITIATTSNAIDFGDVVVAAANKTGTCNNTRGVIIGGFNPSTKAMDYITIATTGNAADFGDSIHGYYGMNQGGVVNSPTRGLFGGGNDNTYVNSIQYITIATLGDATDFGDLTHTNGYFNVGACSETRGLFMGGSDIDSPYATVNTIEYVTIATTGSATDFGDLTLGRYTGEGVSNGTRGVFCGGATGPAAPNAVNNIDYITIATTGNAADFGDMYEIQRQGGGMSDSHGGLS